MWFGFHLVNMLSLSGVFCSEMRNLEDARPANGNGCLCCFKGKSRSMGSPEEDLNCQGIEAMQEGIETIRTSRSCVFADDSDLCICLVTWNMNGGVCFEDLAELVGSKLKYDLLVMGLQEAPRGDIAKILQSALTETHVLPTGNHSSFNFEDMRSRAYFLILALHNTKLVRQICDAIRSALCFRTRGLGLPYRRVAIGINYRGISMVFIACHLAAHAHNVEERNAECRHISHALFSKDRHPCCSPAQVTVWLGDLNYRLEEIGTYPARKLIQKQQQHKMLISKGQLLHEAERGKTFDGYCEGAVMDGQVPFQDRGCQGDKADPCGVTNLWTTSRVLTISPSKLIYA